MFFVLCGAFVCPGVFYHAYAIVHTEKMLCNNKKDLFAKQSELKQLHDKLTAIQRI